MITGLLRALAQLFTDTDGNGGDFEKEVETQYNEPSNYDQPEPTGDEK